MTESLSRFEDWGPVLLGILAAVGAVVRNAVTSRGTETRERTLQTMGAALRKAR